MKDTHPESEGVEKQICKWKQQGSRGRNNHSRQNKLLKEAMKNDKEGPYEMIKGWIYKADTMLFNVYPTNIGVPKYIQQI